MFATVWFGSGWCNPSHCSKWNEWFILQGYQWILTSRGQDASRQRGSYSPVPQKVQHFNLFLCTTVRMQNYYMYGLGYCNLIGVMYVFVKD